MKIECFLTNIYSVDIMAPFCIEMKKRGYDCHLAIDEMFWKLSYGEHFDVKKVIEKSEEYGVKLNLRLDYNIDIAVTQWKVDWALFGLYKNLKAKISYGVSLKKNINFARGDLRFDLYFIHGEFEKQQLLSLGVDEKRIIKIGFPKLKYQNTTINYSKQKPVMTYFSTWDEFRNIDNAILKLKHFKDNYQILCKPHPLQSKEDIEKLKKEFLVLDKNINIKSIVNISDVILIDLKSGVIGEILSFTHDKIVIGLCKNKEEYEVLKNELDLIIEYQDKLVLPTTVKDKSKIKKYLIEDNMEEFSINVNKISPTINKTELEILKERLEKTYKEYYTRT